MGRHALAATSLVAAIPGGFLAYVTIMSFVRYADAMGSVGVGMYVINGAAVAIAALLVIMPIAIEVGRRSDKKDTAAAEATQPAEDADAAESVAQTAQVVSDEEAGGGLSDEMDLDEAGEVESAETDAFEFNMDDMDESEGTADDAFEFDDDDLK